jgi:hypothetical protein
VLSGGFGHGFWLDCGYDCCHHNCCNLGYGACGGASLREDYLVGVGETVIEKSTTENERVIVTEIETLVCRHHDVP